MQPASLQISVSRLVACDAFDFVLDDRPADGGIFDGERSAKSAALIGLFHRLEIDVADLASSRTPSSFTPMPRRWQV